MLALLFVLLATLIGALLVRLVWRVLWAPTFERSLRSQTSLPLPEWVIFWPALYLIDLFNSHLIASICAKAINSFSWEGN